MLYRKIRSVCEKRRRAGTKQGEEPEEEGETGSGLGVLVLKMSHGGRWRGLLVSKAERGGRG